MATTSQIKPKRRLTRIFTRFRENQQGSTAVEFAMVSVPFLGLLFAIFETSFVFFTTEALEAATATASRTIMTGGASSYTTADGFKTAVVCPLLPSFITCSSVVVDANTVGSYGASTSYTNSTPSKTITTNATTHNFCIGTQGDVIILRIAYAMPVYLSLLSMSSTQSVSLFTWGAASGTTPVHNLMSVAAFKNEPFGTTQAKNTGCS